MLNPSHITEMMGEARCSRRSIINRSVELTDMLTRLPGMDVEACSEEAPFEFVQLARALDAAIEAFIVLESLREEAA